MAREDVRAKILAASRSVFASRGFRAATVREIISEAGIARATFYKYFPNKSQCYFELLTDFLDSLYSNTSEYILANSSGIIYREDFYDRLKNGLMLFYSLFLDNLEIAQTFYREAFGADVRVHAAWTNFHNKMTDLLRRVLENGIRYGAFRELDAGVIAQALLLVFLDVPYRQLMMRSRSGINIGSLADEMVMFAMNGIMAEDGVPSRRPDWADAPAESVPAGSSRPGSDRRPAGDVTAPPT